jgi:hypothetical protein
MMRVPPPGTSDSTAQDSIRRDFRGTFPWFGVAAAVVAGLVLRWPALFQDPWIDEIWSWGLARSRGSIGEVLTIESSNSHALMTLWIWLVGDQLTFFLYRLPSLAAGIACIPLAARIAFRHGRSAALAAAWIVAVSFLGVVFSSEARGYALMVACSLGAFECAWTWLDSGRRRWLALGWICAAVGVLAQTLFVVGWAAIAAAVIARILREGGSRRIRRVLAFTLPPIALFVAWWFVNVRHVFNAGAPPWEMRPLLTEVLGWSIGLPLAGWTLLVGAPIAAAVLLLDEKELVARRDAISIAQLGLVLFAPAVISALLWNEFLAARYFLVPLAFGSLALARVLGRLADSGARPRWIAVLVLAAFAAGNTLHTVEFLRVGRGTLGSIVHAMAERSGSRPIVVTGNYDFNVGAQIEWHKRTALPSREFLYVSQGKLSATGADFAIVNRPRFAEDVPRAIRVGNRGYALMATSIHSGPSGTDWAVYQRADE